MAIFILQVLLLLPPFLLLPQRGVIAGHSCEHELETARINGVLGNIDANTGEAGASIIQHVIGSCVSSVQPTLPALSYM